MERNSWDCTFGELPAEVAPLVLLVSAVLHGPVKMKGKWWLWLRRD